jgi:hypothetical protein
MTRDGYALIGLNPLVACRAAMAAQDEAAGADDAAPTGCRLRKAVASGGWRSFRRGDARGDNRYAPMQN